MAAKVHFPFADYFRQEKATPHTPFPLYPQNNGLLPILEPEEITQ